MSAGFSNPKLIESVHREHARTGADVTKVLAPAKPPGRSASHLHSIPATTFSPMAKIFLERFFLSFADALVYP